MNIENVKLTQVHSKEPQLPEDGPLAHISPEESLFCKISVQRNNISQLFSYLGILFVFQTYSSDVTAISEH